MSDFRVTSSAEVVVNRRSRRRVLRDVWVGIAVLAAVCRRATNAAASERRAAFAGTGGNALANAGGGAIAGGDVSSGGNTGNAINIGNSVGSVDVLWGTVTNHTTLDSVVPGGVAVADTQGGNAN